MAVPSPKSSRKPRSAALSLSLKQSTPVMGSMPGDPPELGLAQTGKLRPNINVCFFKKQIKILTLPPAHYQHMHFTSFHSCRDRPSQTPCLVEIFLM